MKTLLRNLLPVALLLAGTAGAGAVESNFIFTYSNGITSTNVGNKTANPYEVAMLLKDADYVGMKVTGAKILFAYGEAEGVVDYSVWASNTLTTTMSYLQKKDAQVVDGSIETTFDTPVELTDKGLYIGYSFNVPEIKGTESQYPVIITGPASFKNAFFLKSGKNNWSNYGTTFGAAPIAVYLSGVMKVNAVQLGGLTGSKLISCRKDNVVKFKITNKGSEPVKSIGYTYTLEGQTHEGTTELTEPLAPAASAVVPMTVCPASKEGNFRVKFTITKVNGQNNESASTVSSTVQLEAKTFLPVNRPVMEEMTATGCGWCTRGWFAMKEMKKIYPGKFIGMAYHASDIMEIPGGEFPFSVGEYPSCRINRYTQQVENDEGEMEDDDPDPYFGYSMEPLGIKAVYDEQADSYAYASLDLLTSWNADSTLLDVTTKVQFAGTDPATSYKIGYVILQNGICHPDMPSFSQNNAYSGRTSDANGPLKELVDLPSPIAGFPYDDIVIDLSLCKGVENSLPGTASIEVGKIYEHKQQFSTSSMLSVKDGEVEYIQNPAKMDVVAMLINADNKVVNARMVTAGQNTDEETAISTIAADNTDAQATYFDLMGRQIANPGHGLYIIKQGNKASKVIL